MSEPMPDVLRVGQIALTVRRLGPAVAFYRDTLGLKFMFDAPNMAFFDLGNLRLMLGMPETPDAPVGNSIVYYLVADIQAAQRALAARGVAFIAGPHLVAKLPDHDLWMGFLHDPEGNTVALMSEVRPPAPVDAAGPGR